LWRGSLHGQPDAIERIAARAGADVDSGPPSYVDRDGLQHLSFSQALDLAKAFAAAEPTTVLARVQVDQRQLETEAREPGRAYLMSLLEGRRAEWAIIRQWAGTDQQLAELTAEIDRLRTLITRSIWSLRDPTADPESVARSLERALHGR
jgi:hypothetical protein